MTKRMTSGRLAIGGLGALAAIVGFAIAIAPGFAGGVASNASTETGTGTTETSTKVLVCHKAKVTIRVSTNAWPAHRRHGDTAGACTQAQLERGKAAKQQKQESDETDDGPGNGKPKAKGKGNKSS